jgi:hypothetical protein
VSARPELPELADLLAGARRASSIPPETLAKVGLRLEKTLSIPRLNVPLRDEVAAKVGVASPPPVAGSLRAFLRHRAAIGLGMYVLGALSALELQNRLPRSEKSPPISEVAPPGPSIVSPSAEPLAPFDSTDPARAADPAPRLAPAPSASATSGLPAASSKPAAAPRSKLADERELIEVARAGLTRGRPQEALAALEEHRRRFPSGELEEESESLRVQALVARGSYEEARAAADRFNTKYPGSMLRASVNHALQSIP